MKKVLYIEDEGTLRAVVHDKIIKEEPQITFLEAVNGEEGLEVALKEKPDLILLDIIIAGIIGVADITCILLNKNFIFFYHTSIENFRLI